MPADANVVGTRPLKTIWCVSNQMTQGVDLIEAVLNKALLILGPG